MSKTKGLVSVIIPTFNSGLYIEEAVRSVLDQSYTDLEVLVIDDGSTDATREVVGTILDDRLRYIPMEERCGNYFARNKGISLSRGEYLAFLDADDLWAKDKLRKQMAVFEKRPEVGICFSDHLVFKNKNKKEFFTDLINTYSADGRDYNQFIRRLLIGNFVITSSVLAKRECFDRLGQFDTAFQNAMDYDMWLRIVLNYKPHYIPGGLVFRRIHKLNISRNKVNSMKAVGYVLDKLLSEGTKHTFYSPEFEPLIRKHREVARYYLGLEYLETHDFENGKACLEACRLPEKALFRFVALLAAKTRSEPILRLIHLYRKKRIEIQLSPQKIEKSPLFLDGCGPLDGQGHEGERKDAAIRISVIIATLNRPDDLMAVLESLYAQARFPEEILVIDQSTDRRTEQLVSDFQARYPEKAACLRYVYQEEKSLVKARNRGINCARGDVLSFLDDDVVLDERYFETILEVFERNPQIVALSGNTRVDWPWTGWKWTLRQVLHNIFLINHYNGRMTASGFGYPIYEREIECAKQVEMLPGCNMNFRFSAIGEERFDEWFTGYGYREDAEFSYRISKKGKVWMIPDARLVHNYSRTGRLSEEELKRMKIRNYYYVFHKFKGRSVVSALLFVYSLIGLSIEDFFEFIFKRSEAKWKKFTSGIHYAFSVWKKL